MTHETPEIQRGSKEKLISKGLYLWTQALRSPIASKESPASLSQTNSAQVKVLKETLTNDCPLIINNIVKHSVLEGEIVCTEMRRLIFYFTLIYVSQLSLFKVFSRCVRTEQQPGGSALKKTSSDIV